MPAGGEDDFVIIETHGTPRDFEAEGFSRATTADRRPARWRIDLERGAKVTGSRFYFLTGPVALLEFALSQFALTKALEWGFTPMIPPALVKPSAMEGTGFLGQAAEDVYHLGARRPVPGRHRRGAAGRLPSRRDPRRRELPLRYAGFRPAFRREAGSYGKDTKGIFRVHWFDKWEMFVYCDPADAEAEHATAAGPREGVHSRRSSCPTRCSTSPPVTWD